MLSRVAGGGRIGQRVRVVWEEALPFFTPADDEPRAT
jgi:hypothetical protein